MGSKRKQRRKQPVEYHPPSNASAPSNQPVWKWWHSFAIGAMLAGTLATAITHSVMSKPIKGDLRSQFTSSVAKDLPSLGDLALMPAGELAKQDIALLNLRCAEGLPGSEELDVANCLATLDQWAEKVRLETDRHLYKYVQAPEEYEHSEAYFRMLMLITVLQQDFEVHYNPDRIREVDFKNSQDLFIHGMVNCDNGGTCVSMPALYTAVARRLGYPVHLVAANAHVFCRWDSPKERFNIEATNQGMNRFDDAYYMKWPKPIAREDVENGWYLKSLDVGASFAMFLAARGHCLEDNRLGAKARLA